MDNVVEIGARKELKRLQPDPKNTTLLNDVNTFITGFQATGLVFMLDHAKTALDKLVEYAHE